MRQITSGLVGTTGESAPLRTLKTIISDYTIISDDDQILIDAGAGDLTITLPYAGEISHRRPFVLERIDDASTHVVIVSPDQIDRLENFNFTNGVTLVSDGTGQYSIGVVDTSFFDITNIDSTTFDVSNFYGGVLDIHIIDATSDQTTFILPFSYEPGSNELFVYSGGVYMTVDDDYEETDSTSIKFLSGRIGGEKITILQNSVWASTTGGVSTIDKVDVTADYTMTGDEGLINANGTLTIMIPSAFGFKRSIRIANASTGIITVIRQGSDTIEGSTSIQLTSQYATVELISDQTSLQYEF